ncbi:hypothetical protein JOD20_005410 [Herpetosiphon giganteus]|nr:hypothetical protein [Herpetosiphon giganteus]
MLMHAWLLIAKKAAQRKAKQAERAAAGIVVRRGRPRKP